MLLQTGQIIEIQMENQSSMEVLSSKNRKINLFQDESKPKKGFSNLTNGFSVYNYFERYVKTQFCLVYMLIINLAALHVYFELHLNGNSWKKSALIMGNIVSFFAIILIVIRYLTYQQFKVQQNLRRQTDKIQGGFYLVVIKIFVICVQPYPFLQDIMFSMRNTQGVQQYYMNDILFILALFRYGFVIPVLLVNTYYSNTRSTRICKLYGCESNQLFTLKSFFKDFSIQTMIFTFVASSLLFGIAYRAAQYNINPPLKSLQNAVWLAIVTTLTVGYGQLFPVTILGRFVGIICTYWGVLVSSVMVVVLTNLFEINNRQKKALMIVLILDHKQETKRTSALYLRQSLWRVWMNYKNKRDQIYHYKYQNLKQRKLKQQLHKRKIFQKFNFAQDNVKAQMQFNFNKISGYIQNLQDNNEIIMNQLQQKQ